MKRPSIDEYYLNIARAVSERSTCLKKHYGCVIVQKGEVISTGYNGNVRGESHCGYCTKASGNGDMEEYQHCEAVHAEMNALLSASRREMLGADLYLTGFDARRGGTTEFECEAWPCEICLRLIKNAGIDRIINNKGVIYMRSDDGILRQIKEKENN
jgi:dCMP deaminase